MLGRLFQIKIRHIVLVSIILLMLEVISSSFYYYMALKESEGVDASQQLHIVNRMRMSLLYLQAQTPEKFTDFIKQLQKELSTNTRLQFYVSATLPSHGYVVDASFPVIPADMLLRMQNALSTNGVITVVTYIPGQNLWGVFHADIKTASDWKQSFLALFVHLLIIIVLWTTFLLYYRYTLPKEVLQQLSGKRPEPGSRTDTIITNLRQQIQAYYDEKNLMLAALAHDIKTPLTEALLRLELLEDQSNIEPIKENLTAISTIITSSLEFAKAPENIKKVDVEIISYIENIIENYNDKYFNVTLITFLEECELQVELQLFRRMIVNLLDNAKKYATACQIIVNRLSDNGVEITCNDNGPGVPDNILHKLSTPYFRVDKSRSSQTGGTGLGLAIVKKVAQLHHGGLTFKNLAGGGFSVTVTLYNDEPDKSINSRP